MLDSGTVSRVPGTAVFLHLTIDTVPLALRENVTFNHVLHENVIIVDARSANVPFVPPEDRITIGERMTSAGPIVLVQCKFGFQDEQDIPAALEQAREQGLQFDAAEAMYFVSRITVQRGSVPGLSAWRKRLFIAMAHNAANPIQYFRLPETQTIMMGTWVDL